MNIEAAEETPLLAEASWVIKPAAQTLRDHNLQSIFIQDISPDFTVNEPRKLAFVLSVLLYLRQNLLHEQHKDKEPYQRWSQEQTRKTDIGTIEDTMKELWDSFLDSQRDSDDIGLVLWSSFPLEDQKSKTLRVVDFLIDLNAPKCMAGHPVILWSLTKVWKQGVTPDGNRNAPSSLPWIRRYDACCTPRIVHLADVISDFLFLPLVIHILNDPPITTQSIGGWEACLTIFTIGGLCRPRGAHKMSYALALLALLLAIPSAPLPGQTSFMLLTMAMALHAVELHLAQYPSPLYITPVDWSLPLAVYLRGKLAQGIIPIVLYLFPVFLFSSYLLSTSLADTFLRLDRLELTALAPAPFETRVAYLIFTSSVITTAAICTIILTSLEYPKAIADRWDRYSPILGHEARTLWFRTVVAYSDPDLFPSPLSFIHLLQLLPPSEAMRRVQIFIRRLFVGSFALVVYVVCVTLRL